MVNCATLVQHCIRLKGVGIGVRPRIFSEHSQYSSRPSFYQVIQCFILQRLILNHDWQELWCKLNYIIFCLEEFLSEDLDQSTCIMLLTVWYWNLWTACSVISAWKTYLLFINFIVTSIKVNSVAVILHTDYSWWLFTRCLLLLWHFSW